MAVQDDRRGRRTRRGQPPNLFQDRHDLPIAAEGDLVGHAVESDNLAVIRRAPADLLQDMACEREGEPLVIGDAECSGDHLRAVGMTFGRTRLIDPHQEIAGRSEVACSQVHADEQTMPITKPVLVVCHGLVPVPALSAEVPLPVGLTASPADGLIIMGRWWIGRVQEEECFPRTLRVGQSDFRRDELLHVRSVPPKDRGGTVSSWTYGRRNDPRRG